MSITQLDVKFNSINATNDLAPHLINWTYTDNLSDAIDDLSITLEDVDAVWLSDWFPDQGTVVNASIIKNGMNGQDFIMDLGLFEIDTLQGSDSTVTIAALATSEVNSLRRERKSMAWEKTKLKTIYSDIAIRNGLNLYWEASENPTKERVEQINESDLAFLHSISREEGLCLKLANKQLIVLDELDYENQLAQYDIRRTPREDDLIRIAGNKSFSITLNDIYKSCIVTHTVNKKTYTGSYTPKKPPKTEKVLELKEAVTSQVEADRIAKKRLREKNKQGTIVTLDVFSLVPLRAGMTFNLIEFGKLNGKYITTKVIYSGARVTLTLRKCLEGY